MKWSRSNNPRWGNYERVLHKGELFIVHRLRNGDWFSMVTDPEDELALRPWESGSFPTKKEAQEAFIKVSHPEIAESVWRESQIGWIAVAGDNRVLQIKQMRARKWALLVFREGQRSAEWPAGGITHFCKLQDAKDAGRALARGWITPTLSPLEIRRSKPTKQQPR